jgi:phosphoribosylanthranilate isomerase
MMATAPLWIKICGMTTAAAIEAALAARVDAVGFVFAESIRRVTTSRACELAAPIRGKLRCVAVTRHPLPEEVATILAEFAPDILQTDYADLATLQLPVTLEVLPVLRAAGPLPTMLPSRALFEGPQSGTGAATDWQQASRIAARTQTVLAGGLNAENVGAAIRTVRPFGVDVSSGVEAAPAVKSVMRIAEFVAAARQAAAEIDR